MAKKLALVESIGPICASGWIIDEAIAKTGKLVVRGKFGECDAVNGNGRVYPLELMESQVTALQPKIENRQVTCQLDHPGDGKDSLTKVAAKLTKLWIDKKDIMGEAEVLNTINGKELRALFEGGVNVGVSSRGSGSTKRMENAEVVQEDFVLNTFDFVGNPSVSSAIPKVYAESLEGMAAQQDPITLFETEFPEQYASLLEAARVDAVEKAKGQIEKSLEVAVEAERARVKAAMTETFERQLRDTLVTLREDMEAELRAEYAADPALGGAKAALAQIIEMVAAYHQPPAPDAMQDALRARELEITAAEQAKDEALQERDTIKRLLEMEKKIAGHPLATHLRSVLTPVVTLGTIDNVDQAVEALIVESKGMVPISQVEILAQERIALAETQAQYDNEKKLVSQLNEEIERLKKNLKRAADIGVSLEEEAKQAKLEAEEAEGEVQMLTEQVKELQLDVYKHAKLLGISNAKTVLAEMQDVKTQGAVDKVIADRRATAMADGKLEEARRQIRGVAPDSPNFRIEEKQAASGDAAAQGPLEEASRGLNQLWGLQ